MVGLMVKEGNVVGLMVGFVDEEGSNEGDVVVEGLEDKEGSNEGDVVVEGNVEGLLEGEVVGPWLVKASPQTLDQS